MEPDYEHLLPRNWETLVQTWLDEDIPGFDVGGYVVGSKEETAILYGKTDGVLAGRPFFDRVFTLLGCKVICSGEGLEDERKVIRRRQPQWLLPYSVNFRGGFDFDARMQVDWLMSDGTRIDTSSAENGKVVVARVTGSCRHILQGERTALNVISRCSGVATATSAAVHQAKAKGWKGYVAGTRKTTPGFRLVEKYALVVGGGATHRYDLSQMVMLKDNHIASAGGITRAVEVARQAAGFSMKIEVETSNYEQAAEAARAGADIIMLDNFAPDELKSVSRRLKGEFPHAILEASGGITSETFHLFLGDSVDVISQGALTHGYNCLDFSLKIVAPQA